MTYADSELSTADGKPVELYKINGTYRDYFYTSAQRDVKFLDDIYKAIPIKRSELNAGTSEDDGGDLTVDLPSTLSLVYDYAMKIAPPELMLTVLRYHDKDEWIVYWSGPISTVKIIGGGRGQLKSRSVFANALSAACPSLYYQAPCNNVLFGLRCKVKPDDYTFNGRIIAMAGKTITLRPDSTLGGNGFLRGGELMLLPYRERRMIVNHTANIVQINYPFSLAQVGMEWQATAGCDHAYLGDCKNKFRNQKNFGGFPFIPNKNPFSTGVD